MNRGKFVSLAGSRAMAGVIAESSVSSRLAAEPKSTPKPNAEVEINYRSTTVPHRGIALYLRTSFIC